MTGQTDWLSAIGILLAGLVLGSMFVYAFVTRRRGAIAPADDLELRDLEARRDALLQQLRELDGDDKDERARLEVETAQVLRSIDQHKPVTGVAPPTSAARAGEAPAPHLAPSGFFAKHPELKGFAWGVGSIAALGFLGYFGYKSTTPKDAGAPAPMQQAAPMQQPAAQDDPAIRDLEARVKQSPDDLNLRLELTHAYLDKENLMGVFEQTEYILEKTPNDAQAQTYQALVRMAMGQGDNALALLKSATKNDPSLIDAWVSLAWYYSQTGNKAEAKEAIDQAIKRHPDQKARLTEVLAQMQAQKPVPAATEAAALPAGHPPVNDTPAPMASAAPASGAVVITVNVENGKTIPQGAVLYIIARGVGETAGPPVAVKRISATTFPITVDLSAADSMMGQPIPPKVRIEARLDSDGNVMTKGPTDLDAVQDGVALGSQLSLTLK